MPDKQEIAPLSPEERETAKKGPCGRCLGLGLVENHKGLTTEQHELQWQHADCPSCGNFRKRALATIDQLERERKEAWRVFVTPPVEGMPLSALISAVGDVGARLGRERKELMEALRRAKVHVDELADAWQRGCISEHDGLGGTRSNSQMSTERQPCDCDSDGGCDGIGPILGHYCKIAEHDALESKLALAEERSRLFAKTADEQAEIAESNAEKARALDKLQVLIDEAPAGSAVHLHGRHPVIECIDQAFLLRDGECVTRSDKARAFDRISKTGKLRIDVVNDYVFIEPDAAIMGGCGATLLDAVKAMEGKGGK